LEGIIREISVTEAAGRLGISRQRVLRLIRDKRIRARRAANIYLIREVDLALVADRKPGRPKKADKADATEVTRNPRRRANPRQ
jgi:excisionase family DNA binding protein